MASLRGDDVTKSANGGDEHDGDEVGLGGSSAVVLSAGINASHNRYAVAACRTSFYAIPNTEYWHRERHGIEHERCFMTLSRRHIVATTASIRQLTCYDAC